VHTAVFVAASASLNAIPQFAFAIIRVLAKAN
jgi:hypothetical protein